MRTSSLHLVSVRIVCGVEGGQERVATASEHAAPCLRRRFLSPGLHFPASFSALPPRLSRRSPPLATPGRSRGAVVWLHRALCTFLSPHKSLAPREKCSQSVCPIHSLHLLRLATAPRSRKQTSPGRWERQVRVPSPVMAMPGNFPHLAFLLN